MHRAAQTIPRAASRFRSPKPCRYISGRRYSWSNRNFHTTRRALESSHDTGEGETGLGNNAIPSTSSIEDTATTIDWTKYEKALEHGKSLLDTADKQWPGIAYQSGSGHDPFVNPQVDVRKLTSGSKSPLYPSSHGSWRKRAARNVREETILSIPRIPNWFLERNIRLSDEIPEIGKLLHLDTAFSNIGPEDYAEAVKFIKEEETTSAEYRFDHEQFVEISALARAGLRSANSEKKEDVSISKPHLVLQSAQEGGMRFLNRVAMTIAKTLDTDVIRLGPTAISELVLDMGGELPEKITDSLKLLGYDAYELDHDLMAEEEEEDAGNEDGDNNLSSALDSMFRRSKSGSTGSSSAKPSYKFDVVIPSKISSLKSSDLFAKWGADSAKEVEKISDTETKTHILLETFLDSAMVKRAGKTPQDLKTIDSRKPLIILISEYLELQTTKAGGSLLDSLHEVVQERRAEGQEILIIGLSSSEDLVPSMTKTGLLKIQSSPGQGPYRTIITSSSSWDSAAILEKDARLQIRSINTRHMKDMLRRLAWSKGILSDWCWERSLAKEHELFSAYFDDAVWSPDRLNRVAAAALGLLNDSQPQVGKELIAKALNMITENDKKKINLIHAKEEEASLRADVSPNVSTDGQTLINKIRKSANSHEKKLMHGIIDRKDIKTDFSQVHVPESSVTAIKTLTSLALQRPEAFSYGVLAKDKIPGLLLYGPPGTGKTLLAKAVAGESGATVLEVSGSDIYDMYVGEGEKNVRAVFTLAQKLSPCVVFIDEADAILGSRNSSTNRTTHRDLINQFLREWDGLSSKNTSAFIMVATNRPFDLDDAVLRRLPRRLLVDLPTEKDREAILKIHLADEKLDESVSISDLAERTPFYSGSDLKNICVAAALQAVQEEYDAKIAFEKINTPSPSESSASSESSESSSQAASAQPPTKYTYPDIRTLTGQHFDKALADISASISEDMSSLTAIRKFDEKYGDRRGRQKKGGLGFGTRTAADSEREKREEGRVRREVLTET